MGEGIAWAGVADAARSAVEGTPPGAWALAALLLALALRHLLAPASRGGRRWRADRGLDHGRAGTEVIPSARSPSYADQAAAIATGPFETRPLLNREARPLLLQIEGVLAEAGSGWRVMAQVSLGEIVGPRHGGASREARRKAGVGMIEVEHGWDAEAQQAEPRARLDPAPEQLASPVDTRDPRPAPGLRSAAPGPI